jgi:DNA polymerase-3 subunit alpha
MIAGTLISIQEKKTVKGNPYAIIKLVDLNSMYEMFIFSEKLVENRNKLVVGNSFLIKAKKETNKEGVERINLDNIFFIEDLTKKIIDKLVLQIDNLESLNLINSKKDTNGKSKLKIIFNDPKEKGQYSFSLNSSFNIKPEDIELFKTNNIKAFY